jgi:hypothetical protein
MIDFSNLLKIDLKGLFATKSFWAAFARAVTEFLPQVGVDPATVQVLKNLFEFLLLIFFREAMLKTQNAAGGTDTSRSPINLEPGDVEVK